MYLTSSLYWGSKVIEEMLDILWTNAFSLTSLNSQLCTTRAFSVGRLFFEGTTDLSCMKSFIWSKYSMLKDLLVSAWDLNKLKLKNEFLLKPLLRQFNPEKCHNQCLSCENIKNLNICTFTFIKRNLTVKIFCGPNPFLVRFLYVLSFFALQLGDKRYAVYYTVMQTSLEEKTKSQKPHRWTFEVQVL